MTTLSQLLESRFRGDIRFRGAAYLKAERVSITRVTADEVFGLVRDGTDYQTHLKRDQGELRMFCNCPQSHQMEVSCKHLWATILAVEAAGFLTGSVKPGYIPPFVVESEPLDMDEDFIDDDDRDVFEPSSPATVARAKAAAVAQPVRREWDAQLDKLR